MSFLQPTLLDRRVMQTLGLAGLGLSMYIWSLKVRYERAYAAERSFRLTEKLMSLIK